MNQNIMKGIIVAILILGVIGIISNPFWLFRQIAFMAILAIIIYLVYRLFMRKRMSKEYASYLKAAKQSKKRFNDKGNRQSNIRSFSQAKKQTKASAIKKKKQSTHLTVIEGKKGKKKNRAHL
ncbi:SA1362 family protein [Metabacillus niabensis]|uniref:ABC-type multidrug transport system fused ATPase/permease subunit n=1 Tax=Metabacillus niabensis TaxID=324854 RepID=A0ABT9YY65_9BACI|nr:SA1362 family protein [Metabacillus niabensis]MDQ0224938.1 ABC-type multidrug transport system fused ATPase/permease subunit [Metabacillus niabensis]